MIGYDVEVRFFVRVEAHDNEDAQLRAWEVILTDPENVAHEFEVEPIMDEGSVDI